MRTSVILYIFLNISILLMGQEKVGFYNKNNLIEFNTVDSLVYVENPAKNLVSQNIQVHATGKNFVILKSQKNKIQDIKSLIKTQSLEDTTLNKVEPVLRYKDGTNQICHGEIIVQLSSGTKIDDIFAGYKYTCSKDQFVSDQYHVKLKGKDTYQIFTIINKLKDNNKIKYIEPDFIRFISPYTSDPFYSSQWSIKNTGSYYGGTAGADMSVENAWLFSTGSNVKIAVIDEGVQLDHPDLVSNLLPGYDATGNNSGGGPTIANNDAHGTNCAGIIGAVANNNIGTAGIAYNAKIIPIRIAYSNGYPLASPYRSLISQDSWMASGINYAYITGNADILSNSWGAGSPSSTIDAAINSAVTNGRSGKGCVVLFAAGNENHAISYPASNNNVIAVGATSMCDTRKRSSSNSNEVNNGVSTDPLGVSCDGEGWWGSNYGVGLDIVAPGVKIYSADLTGAAGYSTTDYNPVFNGTSSATPNAAGVMALILSANPDLTGVQARQIIESTCDKIGGYNYQANVSGQPNGTWCADAGYGRVNALKAISAALAISGPSQICTQGTYTINIPAGATVAWSSSNTSIATVAGSGSTATLTGVGNGNVTLSATINNSVTVTKDIWVGAPSAPLRVLNFSNGDLLGNYSIYDFALDYLTDQGVNQFNWTVTGGTILSGQGTNTIEIRTAKRPKGAPNYVFDVNVKVGNACGWSNNLFVTGFVTSGSIGPSIISLAPNPTSDQVEVSISDAVTTNTLLSSSTESQTATSYQISVVDSNGNVVYSATKKEKKFNIQTSSFRNGVYAIKVSDGINTYQNKLIVNH